MSYIVNETFYSLQGEGARVGTPNVFVRFSGCNLRCTKETVGFDCDTEFTSGMSVNLPDLVKHICELDQHDCNWVIFTGGEPLLQLDEYLVNALHEVGFKIAIETNGTIPLNLPIDWVCCSPKGAEHTVRLKTADELRYVRSAGQGIPKPSCKSENLFISPAFEPDGDLLIETVKHCVKLVKEHPEWKLSLQTHKVLRIR